MTTRIEQMRDWISSLQQESLLLHAGFHLVVAISAGIILWLLARGLLALADRHLGDHPLLRENRRILVLARRWALYTVVLVCGTYLDTFLG